MSYEVDKIQKEDDSDEHVLVKSMNNALEFKEKHTIGLFLPK